MSIIPNQMLLLFDGWFFSLSLSGIDPIDYFSFRITPLPKLLILFRLTSAQECLLPQVIYTSSPFFSYTTPRIPNNSCFASSLPIGSVIFICCCCCFVLRGAPTRKIYGN
uniref:T. congolense-specific, cell surface-expressed gene family n=1 Tax=Trypanosoma congolense (strain IL3000) TaxID=1068625 RepID=G0V0K2_TRYCI|nr:hypothetical protein, unlikely [Trypanosoma congolense IL3000]